MAPYEIYQPLGPPGKIGLFAQIRQRFLRSAYSSLDHTELVTKSYQKFPIPFSLIEREDQNARQIVILFRLFRLRYHRITFEK